MAVSPPRDPRAPAPGTTAGSRDPGDRVAAPPAGLGSPPAAPRRARAERPRTERRPRTSRGPPTPPPPTPPRAGALPRHRPGAARAPACRAATGAFRPPLSFDELLRQAQTGTERALAAGEELIEVEFPPAGLAAVPGDGEGANEMTWNMDYLRTFCTIFNRDAEATRIFFPDRSELRVATRGKATDPGAGGAGESPSVADRLGAWNRRGEWEHGRGAPRRGPRGAAAPGGRTVPPPHTHARSPPARAAGSAEIAPRFSETRFKLDYLTDPSGLLDIGLDLNRVDVAAKVEATDRVFVAAYPSFQVQEMEAVAELHAAVAGSGRPVIVFNGEMDRYRSGYYPALFYPKIARLCKTFVPRFEQAYFFRNIKGSRGGCIFRVYGEPWQIYARRSPDPADLTLVWEGDEMPSLRFAQMDVLANARSIE